MGILKIMGLLRMPSSCSTAHNLPGHFPKQHGTPYAARSFQKDPLSSEDPPQGSTLAFVDGSCTRNLAKAFLVVSCSRKLPNRSGSGPPQACGRA